MASRHRFRLRFMVVAVLVTALIIALVTWAIIEHRKPAVPARAPVVSVSVAKVVVQDVPVSITALGAAQAWQSVLIRAQVNGVLKQVNFTEGTDVKAGQPLAEIDPAPYAAVLKQTQGTLVRDRALLEDARLDLARYQKLAAQDSIPQQQLDTQAALVKQNEGTVQTDEAAVATARINLDYCHIVAPVSGRVGLRLADPGNLVSTTDTTGIVSINQVVPIAVTFTVPQGDFQNLSDVSGSFSHALKVEALSQETGVSLGVGELRIADNHVDPATGSIQLKARFPNPNRQLWPGQFVNVRLYLETLSQVMTIPSTAVNQGPKGPYAYVVGADRKVSAQALSIAATQDGIAVVKNGLSQGQTVVTDGQMSLKPGLTVAVRQ